MPGLLSLSAIRVRGMALALLAALGLTFALVSGCGQFDEV